MSRSGRGEFRAPIRPLGCPLYSPPQVDGLTYYEIKLRAGLFRSWITADGARLTPEQRAYVGFGEPESRGKHWREPVADRFWTDLPVSARERRVEWSRQDSVSYALSEETVERLMAEAPA